jgi:hypothetical protein
MTTEKKELWDYLAELFNRVIAVKMHGKLQVLEPNTILIT